MRTGMRLTIQDYFRRSGVRDDFARPASGSGTDVQRGADPFSQVLSAAQASVESRQHGLTIRDYLAKPVSTQRLTIAEPGPSETQAPKAAPAHLNPSVELPSKTTTSSPSRISPQAAPEKTKAVSNPTDQIQTSIQKAAKRYQLSPALINAVVKAESAYKVDAVSHAGAQGLMQLMPGTAKEMGVQDPFDIDQNIDGGARYLRTMLDRYDGDVQLALSAYNAGPGTVAKYNGQVPYAETRNYVSRVMRYARQFS